MGAHVEGVNPNPADRDYTGHLLADSADNALAAGAFCRLVHPTHN